MSTTKTNSRYIAQRSERTENHVPGPSGDQRLRGDAILAVAENQPEHVPGNERERPLDALYLCTF